MDAVLKGLPSLPGSDAGDKLGFLKATVEYALRNPSFGLKFRKYLKELKL